MSLAMDAADLVICLDACAAQHQPQHSGAAKSRVLACCPPSDLPQVIQQLKYLHSNALNHGSGGGSGALSLSFPEAEALDEDTKELSVFLEGLVAAVGLTSNSGESNQSTKQGQKKNHINAAPEKLSVDTSLAQVAVDNEELDEYSVFDPLHQSPKPSAVVSSSSKAPQRSLRQNNSYESLRKGIVTASPLSPDKHTVVMSSDPQIVVHPDAPVSSANGAGGSSNEAANGPPGEKTVERSGKIVDVESKSVGRVGWQTYWFYFKACGGVLAVVGILGGTALSALAW